MQVSCSQGRAPCASPGPPLRLCRMCRCGSCVPTEGHELSGQGRRCGPCVPTEECELSVGLRGAPLWAVHHAQLFSLHNLSKPLYDHNPDLYPSNLKVVKLLITKT